MLEYFKIALFPKPYFGQPERKGAVELRTESPGYTEACTQEGVFGWDCRGHVLPVSMTSQDHKAGPTVLRARMENPST